MSDYDPKEMSGPDFERSLLDSARADPVPQNVQIAWANFAGALGSAASHVEAGSGLRTIDHSGQNVGLSQGVRAGSGKAAAWLVLGAMGGSALTAALLLGRAGGTPVVGTPKPAQLSLSASAANPGNSASELVAKVPTPVVAQSDVAKVPSRRQFAPQSKPTKPAAANSLEEPSTSISTQEPPSALAAEVRQLDSARAAYRNGAFNEAIRLVESYHREFPNGVLSPDADVVAIEAFVGKKDGAAAARRRSCADRNGGVVGPGRR